MILDVNIFNLLRQPNGFSDVDHSMLNQASDFCYGNLEFEHVDEFPIEYQSFFVDDEPEFDVFDFGMCPMDFIADVISTCDTSVTSLDLKPLPDFLKYVSGS